MRSRRSQVGSAIGPENHAPHEPGEGPFERNALQLSDGRPAPDRDPLSDHGRAEWTERPAGERPADVPADLLSVLHGEQRHRRTGAALGMRNRGAIPAGPEVVTAVDPQERVGDETSTIVAWDVEVIEERPGLRPDCADDRPRGNVLPVREVDLIRRRSRDSRLEHELHAQLAGMLHPVLDEARDSSSWSARRSSSRRTPVGASRRDGR